jgi:hypothetical protein
MKTPNPRLYLRRFLAFLVISVAAVWSFDALRNLAEHVGFGPLSWMFPLCIDAVAALGMDIWMSRAPAWKLGRVLALAAIAVSLLGNVLDWWVRSADPLAMGLGAIPPIALAAVLGVIHSNARGTEEREQARRDKQAKQGARKAPKKVQASRTDTAAPEVQTVTKLTPVPRGIAEPSALTSETAPTTRRPRSDRTDEQLIEDVRQLIEETGAEIGKRAVMTQLGIGSDRALKILRVVKGATKDETEASA